MYNTQYLVSSQTLTFSQPSGGSLWKQQLLFGPGDEDISSGMENSASLCEDKGDETDNPPPALRPKMRMQNTKKNVSN